MENTLTLISAPGMLRDEHTTAVSTLLDTEGIWLCEGEAWEVHFSSGRREIETTLKKLFKNSRIDVVVQKKKHQKKQLLIADMDSTIIAQEQLDILGEYAGVGSKIAEITQSSMAGEVDFSFSLMERVKLLTGEPEALLAEVYTNEIFPNPGARTLTNTMKANGAKTALVTGGFQFFAEQVALNCGFDHVKSNRFEIVNGFLTGKVHNPIFDAEEKLKALELFADLYKININKTLAVGDGANDIPMIKRAGLGVAFHAKHVVQNAADVTLNNSGLTGLLYMQGYHRKEFIND